jgi:hypothetical protein
LLNQRLGLAVVTHSSRNQQHQVLVVVVLVDFLLVGHLLPTLALLVLVVLEVKWKWLSQQLAQLLLQITQTETALEVVTQFSEWLLLAVVVLVEV